VELSLKGNIMDTLDQEIIMNFEANGLLKSTDLANSYRVSERTIRRRINKIIDKKLVKLVVVPNFISLGCRAWARIGIKVAPGAIGRVGSLLVANHSIYFVAYTLGRFDILISVYFDTIDKLTHFVNSELTKIKGILYTETMLLASPRKYNLFSWPAPDIKNDKKTLKTYYKTKAQHTNFQLTELDQRILDVLIKDGPTDTKNLSSKIDIGEGTIRKRLKNMWHNEVYRIEVIPSSYALEYEIQATIGITIDSPFPHKIIDSILQYPAVYLASASLGRFNIVIAVRYRKTDLLNQFVTEGLTSIPGIGSTETFLHVRSLKARNITLVEQ
jgi:DNA-binding Lrp family transcriptional regulator